ncbi:MAG: Bro-N domain-containing protein [Clostridia bacterium]|nr:Bro-N domain-containing protein [Clostridia bacterium]
MNDLQIFNNSEFGQIRTVEINGEPYFVGRDVATALGYAKPLNAVAAHVDEDDSLKQGLTDSLGREQETTFINESGVYALVFGSKLESAKRFKRWITSEVLPAIRKTGHYGQMTELEILQMNVNQLVEQERRLKTVESRIEEIEAKFITAPTEYYTIAGFASIRKQKVDVNRATFLGRKASKLSKEYGYDIGKASDPRYGAVNTYHIDVLNEVFGEYYAETHS